MDITILSLDRQAILVPSILFVITVLLGLNTSKDDLPLYIKQYIVTIYIGFLLLSLFWEITGWFLLVYLFVVTLFASINIGFYVGSLEKRLGVFSLAILHISGLFFKAKTYIALFILGLFYLAKIFTHSNAFILMYFGGAMAFHLFSKMRDQFGCLSFDEAEEKIASVLSRFNPDKHGFLKDACHLHEFYESCERSFPGTPEEFRKLLCFIIYVEDRDYFSRRAPVYSFHAVLKRKRTIKLAEHEEGHSSLLDLLFERGFSTIEQQVTRKIALVDNSYHYRMRRKLFVEGVYNPCLIKACLNFERRIRSVHITIKLRIKSLVSSSARIEKIRRKKKGKQLFVEIKILYLLYYFIEILKQPSSVNECFDIISKISRQKKAYLEKQYGALYESEIFNVIKDGLLNALNTIKKDGGKSFPQMLE